MLGDVAGQAFSEEMVPVGAGGSERWNATLEGWNKQETISEDLHPRIFKYQDYDFLWPRLVNRVSQESCIEKRKNQVQYLGQSTLVYSSKIP